MGWFTKTKPAPAAPPRRSDTKVQRAVLGPIICAMVADKEVNQAEIVQLSTFCTISPVFHGFPSAQIAELLREVTDAIGQHGADKVLADSAKALTPPLRETAFAFAARMVVADGSINTYEFAALDAIRRALEVDPVRAREIQDVMMIMLRPANA